MKSILLIGSVLLLTACEQSYRYPCQDSKNWDKEICQKPTCEINRDCPEYIFQDNSQSKTGPLKSTPQSCPKGCN
jgi:hypothetical protein